MLKVTALASRLNTAVTIDNGIMHMMALSNIPMIVLFGPTNSEKFAPDKVKKYFVLEIYLSKKQARYCYIKQDLLRPLQHIFP